MRVANNKLKERVDISKALANEDYYCILCNENMIQKRGYKRCHHFAHKAGGHCEGSKYYDMSEWHRNWQDRFHVTTREIPLKDGKEKRIADVLVNGIVIEFQHSNIPFKEFDGRNKFYNRLGYHVIWIFDGNEIFKNGYHGGDISFNDPLKCLKKYQKSDNVDIFIEGTMDYNLFEDEGTYLYHIENIDLKKGISFDTKYTIEYFVSDYRRIIGRRTLVEIFESTNNIEQLVAYNPSSGYDVLLDKYNYQRIKEGKKTYGRLRKHKAYGKFYEDKVEIYYPNEPDWIYQWSK